MEKEKRNYKSIGIIVVVVLFAVSLLIFQSGITGKITADYSKSKELDKTINFLEKNNITLYIKDTCKPCVKQKEEFGDKIPSMIKKGIVIDCTKPKDPINCYGIIPKWNKDGEQIAGGYIATENLEVVFTKLIQDRKNKIEINSSINSS